MTTCAYSNNENITGGNAHYSKTSPRYLLGHSRKVTAQKPFPYFEQVLWQISRIKKILAERCIVLLILTEELKSKAL